MKFLKTALVILALTVEVTGLMAAESKEKTKAKAYTLKTCLVSDEKLGGDMGDPYVFEYKGQEIRLCCKSCKPDFDKDPAKYLKKMTAPAKKSEDTAKKPAK